MFSYVILDKNVMQNIDKDKLPRHIAIIMDGNGRWAKSKKKSRIFGHQEGMKSIDEVVTCAVELDLGVLTLYAFSSENWSRPRLEVIALMKLLDRFLDKETARFMTHNIKLTAIGRLNKLPKPVQTKLKQVIKTTAANTGLTLNLALSYGSRDEIVDAVQSLCRLAVQGRIKAKDVNEQLISDHLYTVGLPDPDLLIRTSGEMRISNFMLWQISYAELYIAPVFWPDFRRNEFLKAVREYQNRDRRFGKVKNA